jgi:hypothetical protein
MPRHRDGNRAPGSRASAAGGADGIDTSFRDPSGNNIRLTQVLGFDPAGG